MNNYKTVQHQLALCNECVEQVLLKSHASYFVYVSTLYMFQMFDSKDN